MLDGSFDEIKAMAWRILVVDDEPHICSALVRALSLSGYQTEAAQSGQAALTRLQSASFDLMVLDLRMPGMDGIEVMRQAHQIRPDLLIIVLTGHATLESAVAAVKSEAVDYLTKPTGIREITTAIERALQKRAEHLRRQRLLHTAIDVLRQAETLATSSESLANANGLPPATPERANSQEYSERFLRVGALTLDRHKRLVIIDGPPSRTIELTEGEAGLLSLLMARPEQVIACGELVRAMWGYAVTELEAQSLVRPYIFRIRRKIETTPDKPQWLRTVRGRGYVLTLA